MSYSLLLLLKGPMQSWGDNSRYTTRATGNTPTKSGVLGLLASAQGRRRVDPVEDLAGLEFAVRVDQSGSLLRDYQTAQPWQKDKDASAKLVKRYYLSDAAFIAALGSPDREFLEALRRSIHKPTYPLFLGRRSCPAPANLDLGVVDLDVVDALQQHETWYATKAHKKECGREVKLPIYRDGKPGEKGTLCQDVPVSYSLEKREYGWRTVVYAGSKSMLNEYGTSKDPFFEAVMM